MGEAVLMSGSASDTLDQALRKAYTSALFRVGTHEIGARRNQPWLESGQVFDEARLLTIPGALPITDGPAFLGAIGVAGSAAPATDVQCCQAGLAVLAGVPAH